MTKFLRATLVRIALISFLFAVMLSPASPRPPHIRIHRSAAAKRQFERETGHPHGWKGHVADHVIPLACGGADARWNMQWQTIADAKAKGKRERKRCKK